MLNRDINKAYERINEVVILKSNWTGREDFLEMTYEIHGFEHVVVEGERTSGGSD